MSREEYQEKLKVLRDDYDNKKTKLMVECGLSQRKFNNGDIITNNIFTVKVDMVKVYIDSSDYPMPVYHGVEMTKALIPKKNGSRAAIYGNTNVVLLKEYKNELQ